METFTVCIIPITAGLGFLAIALGAYSMFVPVTPGHRQTPSGAGSTARPPYQRS
jgi:hypothetical protein